MNEPTYEELKLGEKAKEAFLAEKPTEYIAENCPVYLNTRPLFANLTVTDGVIAAALAGLGLLLVGNTGTGKSQLAQDFFRYYYGGNKKENGQGVFIRAHPEIDIYNEIFTELNIDKARRELTDAIDAVIFEVDELNRAPTVAQNQFLALGDAVMDYQGRSIRLGKEGYKFLVATANLGNGEFQGTFSTDKALFNRLHVTFDFDYEIFKPTKEDKMFLRKLREADPNVKTSPLRDISGKIIQASRKIGELSRDPGLEALAVTYYLTFGLTNCLEYGKKEKNWPRNCQECTKNTNNESLCALIRAPEQRTEDAMIKYASALYYLAKLKNPEEEIDTIDLMFKSFELTGAYQNLLNPQVLKTKYSLDNPKMMADVVEKLKEDFRANEDYILASLDAAQKGASVTRFFKHSGKLGNYDSLDEKLKNRVSLIEPFTDQREVGLDWMNDFIKFYRSSQ